MSRKIINTNIRLNLENDADRQAWEYLRSMDRKKYKSYSRAVVIALNEYFSRQEQLIADPYLETREKEDRFLKKIIDTIKAELKECSSLGIISGLTQLLNANKPNTELADTTDNNDEYADTALDFADGF
jgi:hypothetical protein